MCTMVNAALGGLSLISDITKKLIEPSISLKAERENLNYRNQIALSNAKKSENFAYSNIQEGIEKSRAEKIKGLEEKNKKIARAAASGFDINSETNQYSYEDTMNLSDTNADSIKNSYKYRAKDYIDQANNYLYEIEANNKSYNNKVLNTSRNSLSEIGQVAKNWYNTNIPKEIVDWSIDL